MALLQGWPLGITLGLALVLALRFGPVRALVFLAAALVIDDQLQLGAQ